MENIVIYGETAFAERIYSYIKFENAANVLSFTNAKAFKEKESIQGIPVTAFEELNEKFKGVSFSILIAIGYVQMNNIRQKIYNECINAGHRIATYISKTATLYSNDIGEGCIIMPNVYIGPGCTIGKGNVIASCTCLSHDNKVGDFNFISSNAIFGGHSTVCDNSFIGLGCIIRDGITVSNYSLIGSATNLLSSTQLRGVYVGNPSHKLEGKDSLNTKI
ncbi:MAG: hypothetical protein IJE76_04740 [Bacteroidales bacterium]|nr:hypothetical protein [Bacteroidales bacterium]